MRVHRFVKLLTATIKLKEARKVIRKWYVYCNFKRHLLVLHNLSFSATGGGPSPRQGGSQIWGGPNPGGVPGRGVPVSGRGGSQFQGLGVPILGGVQGGGVPVPGGGVPILGGSQFQGGPRWGRSQSQVGGVPGGGGPSPRQGGPNSWGGPNSGRGSQSQAGGSQF